MKRNFGGVPQSLVAQLFSGGGSAINRPTDGTGGIPPRMSTAVARRQLKLALDPALIRVPLKPDTYLLPSGCLEVFMIWRAHLLNLRKELSADLGSFELGWLHNYLPNLIALIYNNTGYFQHSQLEGNK